MLDALISSAAGELAFSKEGWALGEQWTLAEQWSALHRAEAHLVASWHAWVKQHLEPLREAEVSLQNKVQAIAGNGSLFGSSPVLAVSWMQRKKISKLRAHPESVLGPASC